MEALLSKINGNKTYASVALAALGCLLVWSSGGDAQTIIMVGILGLLGGTAGIRHALAKTDKKVDPTALSILDTLEVRMNSESKSSSS